MADQQRINILVKKQKSNYQQLIKTITVSLPASLRQGLWPPETGRQESHPEKSGQATARRPFTLKAQPPTVIGNGKTYHQQEMEERKPTGKSEKYWNIVSKRFVNSKRTMNSPALQTVRRNADKYFKTTDIVLDFGCGPGDITFEIAQKTHEVYATDISAGMIEAAKEKAREKSINNIKFIRTNLSDGKFQSDSFDTVTAFNVLQYIEDRKQLFSKIHELLKPQGLFISSTACLRDRKSVLRYLMEGLSKLKIVPKILLYKTLELENEMKGAGFKIIEATNISKVPERLIIARKD